MINKPSKAVAIFLMALTPLVTAQQELPIAQLLFFTHREPDSVTIATSQPDSVTLAWAVKGGMVGPFEIAIRNGTAPMWTTEPPPNATCFTMWYWSTTSFVSNVQGDCAVVLPQQVFNIAVRRYGTSEWVQIADFNLSQVSPSCCVQVPPQQCTGIYQAGTLHYPCN